jgi:hypothetical protein
VSENYGEILEGRIFFYPRLMILYALLFHKVLEIIGCRNPLFGGKGGGGGRGCWKESFFEVSRL